MSPDWAAREPDETASDWLLRLYWSAVAVRVYRASQDPATARRTA